MKPYLHLMMLSWLLVGVAGASVEHYDPLVVSAAAVPEILDREVTDGARRRDIPIRIYFSPSDPRGAAPVIVFSHGLGGSREGSAYLGRHWAARGYVAVFLQHPGSDTAVWRDQPGGQRMAAMRQAANAENFILRVKDVPVVLDQLERWSSTRGGGLPRMRLGRVGMSGHSFGAVTTQAVSGQRTVRGRAQFTDPRIKAALIMSPSSPRRGTPSAAFGAVAIPWMLMTGTNDVSPIGGIDMKSRLAVFPALPAGGKYELVLHHAEHSAFTDRALPGDREGRNPNHHRAILALRTAFWDAYLRDDSAALHWLQGSGARSVLDRQDRWQLK